MKTWPQLVGQELNGCGALGLPQGVLGVLKGRVVDAKIRAGSPLLRCGLQRVL